MNWFVLDGKSIHHKPALDQPATYADFGAAGGGGGRKLEPSAIIGLRSQTRHLFAFMTITGTVHTTNRSSHKKGDWTLFLTLSVS
jgi:hypothetical protein